MTSLLVVAVLLSASPEADGHAVFAKAQQTMLGGARLPWLLLASGSITRSGEEPAERFVLEWEPCGRRDVRGRLSEAADRVLGAAVAVLCRTDPIATSRVERNGSHVRYVWDRPATGATTAAFHFGTDLITIEIDPESGFVAKTRLEQRWTRYKKGNPRVPRNYSHVVGTAELSDFKPVGTMRLPYRMRLQSGGAWEDWTIERIEIVPLP